MQHVTGETDEISRAFRIHAWEPLAVEAVWLKIYRVDFYSSEIKRKKERKKKRKRKRMEFWNPFKKWGIYFCCTLLYLIILLYFVRSEDTRAELGMEFCTYFFRTRVVKIRDSFFFFKEFNFIALWVFGNFIICSRWKIYAKWNRRSDTFDLSFLYLLKFYLLFFFLFFPFFLYVICYVYYSGRVTGRHEKIIK